ncbi:hypothetical protein CXB51_016687 [Gossypium anomalum]|uniref:Uncharacterized protein n=1 Tax=Gossypium anomalum TaxID=47600 RepID=A0A8J5Z4P6_9ROSI|nr:hypothetical protein CXB51_016687 [Gossypium anomalum]
MVNHEEEEEDIVWLDESFFINDNYQLTSFTFGSHVLQLYCLHSASSITGMLCSRFCRQILLTDHNEEVLKILRRNIELNVSSENPSCCAALEAEKLEWGNADQINRILHKYPGAPEEQGTRTLQIHTSICIPSQNDGFDGYFGSYSTWYADKRSSWDKELGFMTLYLKKLVAHMIVEGRNIEQHDEESGFKRAKPPERSLFSKPDRQGFCRMEMTPQTPNDPFYMSAPASPNRISLEVEGLCFFSVPTSPTRRALKVAYETSPNVDEFEFETSRRFNVDEYEPEFQPEEPNQNHGGVKELLPTMAFADELFADGKVMPLKPPPRHQYSNSFTWSSPRSPPTGVLRLPFQRRSLWNDDFDPFMVALKNVKEENQVRTHRRSRSMSPFRERGTTPKETNDYSGTSQHRINQMGLILPRKQSVPDQNRQMGRQQQVKKGELKLAEPKGVLFARRARLVKVGNGKPTKPSEMDSCSTMEGGDAHAKQTKGQKIKNFLFRSGSMRNENKPKCCANGTQSRPKLKRKFSLKAMGITQYKEEKRVPEVTLTTLIQYRPKLLLCMGYGAKYAK